MESLLKERDKWKKGMKMLCAKCKAEKARGNFEEVEVDRNDCCGRRIFENEPDFLEQKSCLEEVQRVLFSTPLYYITHNQHNKNSCARGGAIRACLFPGFIAS